MGFQHQIMDQTSKIFSKAAYSSWIAFRTKVLKRYFLERSMGTSDLGKVNLVDNLLDGAIFATLTLKMLDFFELETGFAVKVSVSTKLLSGIGSCSILLLLSYCSLFFLELVSYSTYNIHTTVTFQRRCDGNVNIRSR